MIEILERRQRLPVSPERAFAFFADAHNLEAITPPWLGFRITTPGTIAMRAGTLIDYRLKLHGVPLRWRTRIESWDPPHHFVDVQLRGPYRLWEHSHSFEPDGNGGVVIADRVRYRVPFGRLANRFVARDLQRIFDYRQEAVARLVGR